MDGLTELEIFMDGNCTFYQDIAKNDPGYWDVAHLMEELELSCADTINGLVRNGMPADRAQDLWNQF